MEANTLELAGRVLRKAQTDGRDGELADDLIALARRYGLTEHEIDKAIEPPPFGEYPVVYYP